MTENWRGGQSTILSGTSRIDLHFIFRLLRCKETANKFWHNRRWHQVIWTNLWHIYSPFKSKNEMKNQIHTRKSHNSTPPTNFTKTQRSQYVHRYFYVNIMILLITKTGKVNWLSVIRLTSRSTIQTTNVLISDQTKYQTRGFKITNIHG